MEMLMSAASGARYLLGFGNGLLAVRCRATADHYWWVWIGVGVLTISVVMFNFVLIWAHGFLGRKQDRLLLQANSTGVASMQ